MLVQLGLESAMNPLLLLLFSDKLVLHVVHLAPLVEQNLVPHHELLEILFI